MSMAKKVRNPDVYDNVKDKEECRSIVHPKIEKLYEQYGWIVFEVAGIMRNKVRGKK